MMVQKEKCSGCGVCSVCCPQNCITMKPDNLGFEYPQVDKTNCTECGLCDRVCHSNKDNKQEILQEILPLVAWAGHAKDEKTRCASSSGGIFTVIAEEILRNNGVVYGAALSDDCYTVKHIRVSSIKELGKLRGSKYIQSKVWKVYANVKEDLNNGLTVLFSGTPCQIESLRMYLHNKEYENLICVEIICHGVPAPQIYAKYIDKMAGLLHGSIKHVFFRDEVGGVN